MNESDKTREVGGCGEKKEGKPRLISFQEALFLIQGVPASGEEEGWLLPGIRTGSLHSTHGRGSVSGLGGWWVITGDLG